MKVYVVEHRELPVKWGINSPFNCVVMCVCSTIHHATKWCETNVSELSDGQDGTFLSWFTIHPFILDSSEIVDEHFVVYGINGIMETQPINGYPTNS